MTSAACLSALLALCSPSAAITLARASLAASASAAMALCSCSGTLKNKQKLEMAFYKVKFKDYVER